jgi:hypothetical protein
MIEHIAEYIAFGDDARQRAVFVDNGNAGDILVH